LATLLAIKGKDILNSKAPPEEPAEPEPEPKLEEKKDAS
jgi:hypothetical protein